MELLSWTIDIEGKLVNSFPNSVSNEVSHCHFICSLTDSGIPSGRIILWESFCLRMILSFTGAAISGQSVNEKRDERNEFQERNERTKEPLNILYELCLCQYSERSNKVVSSSNLNHKRALWLNMHSDRRLWNVPCTTQKYFLAIKQSLQSQAATGNYHPIYRIYTFWQTIIEFV